MTNFSFVGELSFFDLNFMLHDRKNKRFVYLAYAACGVFPNVWHQYLSHSVLFCSVLQLQSLTLRPPLPGTLTIPPNLPLKPTTSSQPPPLSCPRLSNFLLRASQPANAPGKEGATKTESPTAQTKATPVRHLTVPPPCKQPHTYLSLHNAYIWITFRKTWKKVWSL